MEDEVNDDEEFGPTFEYALEVQDIPDIPLFSEEHHCLPIRGEDERGGWWSKHDNGFRAPEIVQDLECGDRTLVEERKRAEDFG